MSAFLNTGALVEDLTTVVTSGSVLNLLRTSATVQNLTGSTSQVIKLPDATLIPKGVHHIILNNSSQHAQVYDFQNNFLFQLDSTLGYNLRLILGGTPQGVWSKEVIPNPLALSQNLKLIGGGTWSFDGTNLTLSSSAYISVSGLANTDNIIAAQTIVLASNTIAWVEVNRTTGGASPLTVLTGLPSSFTPTVFTYVIARRDGSDVLVDGLRLIPGESGELGQGISQETRTFLGSITPSTTSPSYTTRGAPLRTIPLTTTPIADAISSIDTEIDKFFGQLRLTPHSTDTFKAVVLGADRTLLDGTIFSLESGNKILKFSGAIIDFSTGTITDDLLAPLGLNFSPFAIPVGNYFWYNILLEYTEDDTDNRAKARLQVIPADSSNASASLAPYAQFLGIPNSRFLGAVQLFNNAGTLELFNVRQLGMTSGGQNGLLKVRAVDFVSTILPTGASCVIDGITLVNEDWVLFATTSLLGIYQISGVGVSISWRQLNAFEGSLLPKPHSMVQVFEGSELNKTLWFYDSTIDPPWHTIAGASSVYTGVDQWTDPTFDGTLSPNDNDTRKALLTIDKYFRSLQLRRHETDVKRVKILASDSTKTDFTILNRIIADRLMSFSGAEIDIELGNIYASDGITLIDSFIPYTIPLNEYYWYGIGLDATPSLADNTINPSISISGGSGSNLVKASAGKPSFSARITLGLVVVQGAIIGINPISQSDITFLGEATGVTALEAEIAQNTLDINTLQTLTSSVPLRQVFLGGGTIFNLTSFSLNPSNSSFDADFFIDGRWQQQSLLGNFSDGAVRKNSTTQVELSEAIPSGKEFVVLKRTMQGNAGPDLTAINVDMGFVVPKTVGTLLNPASSLIVQDKISADIWEIEVVSGVLQATKIN